MAVQLSGRELTHEPLSMRELPAGACIFCGRRVEHVNDGGDALHAGAWSGDPANPIDYLYCAGPCGDPADRVILWECRTCRVDNVSDPRHSCGLRRDLVEREG